MTRFETFEQWWDDAVCGCLERLVGTNEGIRLQVAAEHVGWVDELRGQPEQWTGERAEATAARMVEQARQDDAFLEQAPPDLHDAPNY